MSVMTQEAAPRVERSHMQEAAEIPAILRIHRLSVSFHASERHASGPVVRAVDEVSLEVKEGRIVALVGESGSGKSTLAQAVPGLLDPRRHTAEGEIWLDGTDLRRLSARELRRYRGSAVAMIFQDPANALNPVLTIGRQLIETIRRHLKVQGAEAKKLAVDQLRRAGLPKPETLLRKFPFQLSGGMCQRVMIAIALVSGAKLLIADEPTTALDVTVQAQILHELDRLRRESGMGILLITHDLGVVAEIADEVYVMKGGRIVESGHVFEIFARPRHAYTRELLECR
ncbi:ABC transporter ATP-binding protein [Paenibacillus tyrfis]|uniref:ABC transporter ATP-binding protein n=1 Tax=Paenibacillus tyrfis TaxID=1501230 RepID=UPI00209DA930|nr:ABC transporter ATP-binding protein [Paenibacillus tyrfis]MCP1310748.1 ABC transporter ATP-binding protein [Paenibacillus tyrfis]